MGLSDLVPGISGGSMALILGIYEKLINAIKNFGRRNTPWGFILPLLGGILLSFILFSQVIHYLLGHAVYRIFLYSLFVGMIAASVFVLFSHLKSWKASYLIFVVAGAIVTFSLSLIESDSSNEEKKFNVQILIDAEVLGENIEIQNYDSQNKLLLRVDKKTLSSMLSKGLIDQTTKVVLPSQNISGEVIDFIQAESKKRFNLKIMLFGAIAISAMLLPGISGSYILAILGAYSLTIGALASFTAGLKDFIIDYDALFFLANLGVGIIVGALLFSRVCARLLQNYHGQTISLLIGFMAGALRAVWPFWSYQYFLDPLNFKRGVRLQVIEPYLPNFFTPIFAAACFFSAFGFFLVFLLERRNKLLKTV